MKVFKKIFGKNDDAEKQLKRAREKNVELYSEIRQRDETIRELSEQLDRVKKEYSELIETLLKSTPPDCKTGLWCGACSFSMTYHIRDSYYEGNFRPVFICGKAGACKHFVPAEDEK